VLSNFKGSAQTKTRNVYGPNSFHNNRMFSLAKAIKFLFYLTIKYILSYKSGNLIETFHIARLVESSVTETVCESRSKMLKRRLCGSE
jgi:hypothetical protein